MHCYVLRPLPGEHGLRLRVCRKLRDFRRPMSQAQNTLWPVLYNVVWGMCHRQ